MRLGDSLRRLRCCRQCLKRHGAVLLAGPLVRAAVPSRNGRSYDRAVLVSETASYALRKESHYGTFHHPAPSSPHYARTPAELASHRVVPESLSWDGDDTLTGSLEISPNAAGRALVLAYLLGAELGVSLRGWSLPASGASELQLSTFDVVTEPAFPGCLLHVVE